MERDTQDELQDIDVLQALATARGMLNLAYDAHDDTRIWLALKAIDRSIEALTQRRSTLDLAIDDAVRRLDAAIEVIKR
jgi:hypothetical protein